MNVKHIESKAKYLRSCLFSGFLLAVLAGSLTGCSGHKLSTLPAKSVNLSQALTNMSFHSYSLNHFLSDSNNGFSCCYAEGQVSRRYHVNEPLAFYNHHISFHILESKSHIHVNNYISGVKYSIVHYKINSRKKILSLYEPNQASGFDGAKYKLVHIKLSWHSYNSRTYTFIPIELKRYNDKHYHYVPRKIGEHNMIKLTTDGRLHINHHKKHVHHSHQTHKSKYSLSHIK